MFGLSLADSPLEDYYVYADCWDTFILFEALSTQWRTGPGGAVGLDYTAISSVGKLLGYNDDDLSEIFPNLRVMEAEALLVMDERRQAKE